MVRNYRKWHRALGSDPSAVGFWKMAFYLGMGRFVIEMLLVIAIFFILKPRPNMFGGRANPESPMYARDDEPDKR
jgi:hypothetical protein